DHGRHLPYDFYRWLKYIEVAIGSARRGPRPHACTALPAPLILHQRLAERLEQCAVDRIAVGLVLGMPLHAERKTRRVGDGDGLDGLVLRHALDDDAFARLEDALTVQRVDPDGLGAEQFCEHAARLEPHVVAVGEDDV